MNIKLDINVFSVLFQGFFCRTEDEFDDWCMRIRRVCLSLFVTLIFVYYNLIKASLCFWNIAKIIVLVL